MSITNDSGPAGEVTKASLPREHPAETTTFIASLVVIAGVLGLDLSTEAVVAVFAVIGLLPTMVTWIVNLYHDTARSL